LKAGNKIVAPEPNLDVTTATDAPRSTPKPIKPNLAAWLGLGLLTLTVFGWLLTFPTVKLLTVSLTGDITLFRPGQLTNPVADFFYEFPQLLWLGFVAGAGLLFISREQRATSSEPRVASHEPQIESNHQSSIINSVFVIVIRQSQIVNRIWRGVGIALLLAVLVIAALNRLAPAQTNAGLDLIRTDYDEGVYASGALLMMQGKTIYRDFFLTQPPLTLFIWSLGLRATGAPEWGGLQAFLNMRFFNGLISLVTIALVYITGRKLGGRWGGVVAGGISALVLALDGGAVRTEQQLMLEPLLNLFTIAAVCLFVHAEPLYGNKRWWLLVAAGAFAGIAVAAKVPGVVLVVALALTLIAWRNWRGLVLFGAGVLEGFLAVNLLFLATSGASFIKQAYLYQMMRPFNTLNLTADLESETTLIAFEYLARTPYLAFTLLAAVAGLVAIVANWAVSVIRRETEIRAVAWLPVTLLAALTCFFYTGKAGFFPHYYDHMALPLALLAGGVVNAWQLSWWRKTPLVVAGGVAALFGLFIAVQAMGLATREPSKPEWSIERATAASFDKLALEPGTVMTWDPRYTFVMGREMVQDAYGRYFADSAAYVEYLALGLEEQTLPEVFGKALFQPDTDLRQLRYTDLVQQDLLAGARNATHTLLETRADSQLSPATKRLFVQNFINRLESSEITVLSNRRIIPTPSEAVFGGQMRLVGYSAPSALRNGGRLPLKLYWQGQTKMTTNYIVFVHLLNQNGEKVAQRDTAPRNGARDTSLWQPGEPFEDDQSLDLATDLPPGRYKVVVGVYRPVDGARLAVQPGSGDNLLELFEVNILGL
jgi:4-amino-4-deoxy-L-arabinose transferase-like glycosyltransferase